MTSRQRDECEDTMTSRGSAEWDLGAIPIFAPEILGEVISALADLAVVVTDDGKVVSVLADTMRGSSADPSRWRAGDMRDFLTVESIAKFDRALADAHGTETPRRSVELNHADPVGRTEFPVVYTFHPLGPDAGILMMGRDLRPIAEMQQQLVNAQIALERDYEVQREYDTRFRVLMAAIRDAVLIVSVPSGRIADANGPAAALLGQSVEELSGQEISQIFEDQGKSEFMADMAASALSEGTTAVRLCVSGSRRSLRAAPTFFRAAGNRMMLCRLEPQITAEAGRDELVQSLSEFYRSGPEAIVFTNRAGDVVAANDTFLQLTESAHSTVVRGRSIADFLGRGIVDMKILLENATRSGQIRMYTTKLNGQYRSQRAVEISITHLTDASEPGFVLVMRDATIGDTARALKGPDADRQDGHRSVVDLVGNASLREIVADTTEVIEKVCIEAAVELTSNNRVAAAEMLGLSRQSLYNKLRKYGLLARSDGD